MTTTLNPRTKEFRQERAALFNQGRRRCNTCLEIKPLDEYGPHQRGSEGIHGTCNPCRSKYNGNWSRQRTAEDPLYRRIEVGRYRARKAGLPCELFDSEDLRRHWESVGLSEFECVYTGQALDASTLSIEHVQPLSIPGSAGHVLTNCVPAHVNVNTSRGKRHIVDFLADRAERERVSA